MLRESRQENLKIFIAPLNIKLSSLKSAGIVFTAVLGYNNLYFIAKINTVVIFYDLKKKTFYDLNRPRINVVFSRLSVS